MITGRGREPRPFAGWRYRIKNRKLNSQLLRETLDFEETSKAHITWTDWFFKSTGSFNTYTHTGTGGLVLDGTATIRRIKVSLGTGGLILAGDALDIKRKVTVATGGLALAGTAPISKRKAVASTGSIVFNGDALVRRVKTFLATGEIVFSGTAPKDFIPAPPAGGGGSSRVGHKWHRNQN